MEGTSRQTGPDKRLTEKAALGFSKWLPRSASGSGGKSLTHTAAANTDTCGTLVTRGVAYLPTRPNQWTYAAVYPIHIAGRRLLRPLTGETPAPR